MKPKTPGAKKVRRRSPKWHAQDVPGSVRRRVPLCTDKEAAKRMLAEILSRAERGLAGVPDADAGFVPMADHVTAFEADVKLGLASRSKRGRRTPDPQQAALVVQRVRTVIDGCGWETPADLTAKAPAAFAAYLQQRAKLPRAEGGLSAQTAAFYLAATRRFMWWLAKRTAVPAGLFDDVPGFDPAADRKHARRELTAAELGRLLTTTEASGRAVRGLTGADRYALYLTAIGSGFRAGELAVLHPEAFDLDAVPPVVVLPAKHAKNKRAARQPLPPDVAGRLRGYLAGKPAGQPVWPGAWRTNPVSVLKRDLLAAGITYRLDTPDGPRFADFHALRHSYLSSLAAAGVGPKELQTLARHSDPRLTLGIYTHARPDGLAAAAARLTFPGGGPANPVAGLSRPQLESLVAGLSAVVAVLTGCPCVSSGVSLNTGLGESPVESEGVSKRRAAG